MIEHKLPRGKWKPRRKKLFVTVTGIENHDEKNDSGIAIPITTTPAYGV